MPLNCTADSGMVIYILVQAFHLWTSDPNQQSTLGVALAYTTRLFPLCLGLESLYVVLSPHKYCSAVSGDRDA